MKRDRLASYQAISMEVSLLSERVSQLHGAIDRHWSDVVEECRESRESDPDYDGCAWCGEWTDALLAVTEASSVMDRLKRIVVEGRR